MNNNLPPPAVLMHLAGGKFVTQALAAAAELDVAEQLVDRQTILTRCRDAMAPGGRVLVVEMVVPPPGSPVVCEAHRP